MSFLDRLQPVATFIPTASFYAQTRQYEKYIALYLHFPLVEDPQLVRLQRHLDGESIDGDGEDDVESWYNVAAVFENITHSIDDFLQYQAANEDNPDDDIAFVFTITHLVPPGRTWLFSKITGNTRGRSRSTSSIFTPPYPPRNLAFVKANDGTSSSFDWDEPEFGADNVVQYQLEFTEVGTGPIPVVHKFTTMTKVESFQVTRDDIDMSTPYHVVVRGLANVGHTAPSDPHVLHSGTDVRLNVANETFCPNRVSFGRLEVSSRTVLQLLQPQIYLT